MSIPSIRPISLQQYAGVQASLAAEIPLADVLRQEEIPADAWIANQQAAREQIVGSVAVQVEYGKHLRQAEDCLARPLPPIDSDPAAWAGVLGAVAVADDASAVLAKLGLTLGDMSCLGRLWRRKAEKDANLAKTLNDLAGKAPLPAPVKAAPVALKRFPWSPPVREAPAPSPKPAAQGLADRTNGQLVVYTDVDLYAALLALLALAPQHAVAALRACGLAEIERAALIASWNARFAANKTLEATFKVKLLDHRAVAKKLLLGATGFIREPAPVP